MSLNRLNPSAPSTCCPPAWCPPDPQNSLAYRLKQYERREEERRTKQKQKIGRKIGRFSEGERERGREREREQGKNENASTWHMFSFLLGGFLETVLFWPDPDSP